MLENVQQKRVPGKSWFSLRDIWVAVIVSSVYKSHRIFYLYVVYRVLVSCKTMEYAHVPRYLCTSYLFMYMWKFVLRIILRLTRLHDDWLLACSPLQPRPLPSSSRRPTFSLIISIRPSPTRLLQYLLILVMQP